MSESDPNQPFYLIITDHDCGVFAVEGPMTDDTSRNRTARHSVEGNLSSLPRRTAHTEGSQILRYLMGWSTSLRLYGHAIPIRAMLVCRPIFKPRHYHSALVFRVSSTPPYMPPPYRTWCGARASGCPPITADNRKFAYFQRTPATHITARCLMACIGNALSELA